MIDSHSELFEHAVPVSSTTSITHSNLPSTSEAERIELQLRQLQVVSIRVAAVSPTKRLLYVGQLSCIKLLTPTRSHRVHTSPLLPTQSRTDELRCRLSTIKLSSSSTHNFGNLLDYLALSSIRRFTLIGWKLGSSAKYS